MVSKIRFISEEDVEHLNHIEFESPLHMLAAVAHVVAKFEIKEGKKPISDGEPSSSSSATHNKIKIKLSNNTISAGEPKPEKKRKIVPEPSRPLPEEVRRAIGELAVGRNVSPPIFVIEKKLFKTDVEPNNQRFSIPFGQMATEEFLTEVEKQNLANRMDMEDVKTIVPSMDWKAVTFKQWYYKRSSMYCIYGSAWKDIVKDYQLDQGMLMQLWSFRIDQELCFALVRLS